MAQSLEGVVVDEFNQPIPGVNIIEKDTENGVISEFEGQFKMTLSAQAVLVFSYLGYETKEVSVAGRSQLCVVLSSGVALSEVFLISFYFLNSGISNC